VKAIYYSDYKVSVECALCVDLTKRLARVVFLIALKWYLFSAYNCMEFVMKHEPCSWVIRFNSSMVTRNILELWVLGRNRHNRDCTFLPRICLVGRLDVFPREKLQRRILCSNCYRAHLRTSNSGASIRIEPSRLIFHLPPPIR
jgi:hypothetical protein